MYSQWSYLHKKTAYRYAANREELIGLAVRQWTDEYAPSMQTDPQDIGDVAQALRAILESICTHVLSKTAVDLFRLLTTEFPGKRELLDRYEHNGIERGRILLSGWLEKQSSKGLLHAPEPALLANTILAAAVAEPLRQMALGVRRPIPEETVSSHLDDCMKVFSLLVFQPCSTELQSGFSGD